MKEVEGLGKIERGSEGAKEGNRERRGKETRKRRHRKKIKRRRKEREKKTESRRISKRDIINPYIKKGDEALPSLPTPLIWLDHPPTHA